MSETVHCDSHGEGEVTIVCIHLTEHLAGLGFNHDEPSEEDPFPDALCDNCDLILQERGGWNDVTEELIELKVLCSGCYEKSRIRNTRTDVSFEDLSSLRWKCSSCEEWHYGPCLDFCYDSPTYWTDEHKEANDMNFFSSGRRGLPRTFLDEDKCILDGTDYFVRGIIELPIIGTTEMFRWGVWGSLSKKNFVKLLRVSDDPKRVELSPMFSWLSNSIPDYPGDAEPEDVRSHSGTRQSAHL